MARKSALDLLAAALAVLLFAAAAVVGAAINDNGILTLKWPPMFARWAPHAGPGTPAALLVAGLVLLYGPPLARRLPWRWLVPAVWAASMAWVWSLALIDGWRRGVARRLAYGHEYLTALDDIDGIGHFLHTFTDHIPIDSPDNWPAHVAGHPPGATLTFVLLDRVGLAGGAWAAVFVITAASSAAAAVAITLRALAGEELARRAAPFLVLAPAAVWLGVSADGWFAAVAAWAVALLALAATRSVRAPRAAALGSGVLFGLLLYLSYGLALMGVVGLAVLWLARDWRPLPWVLVGIVPWVVAFTAAGFWYLDGYTTLVDRYYAGSGGHRPYSYFIWANLAVQVASVGLATAAGLRRAGVPEAWRDPGRRALVVLVGAGLTAMLLADLSGMSKAETERIWLPFALWLLPAAALLPERGARGWLAAQAVLAMTVNHLWITRW
ncbi:hypothetical protein RM590_18990 [Streptomyces sp. DSM 44938]|uniref:Integral membrane protein n=1 Tax=Streptomyces litchfieldiae TaxID=3075543 RepID=A0ABU2MTE7_9ACTN|nr:hypothetical protein [Streptomyces sp. DSM 44938]MDT0344682.1 hypothetical protein [Streptomyces sp. DSM 44938]